jgi:hypothetical protein
MAIAASCGIAFIFIAVLVLFAPRGHMPVAALPAARAQSRVANTVELTCKICVDQDCSYTMRQLIVDLDNRKVTEGTGASATTYDITDVDDNWINYENHHPPSDMLIGYYRMSISRHSLQLVTQEYDPHGKLKFGYSSTSQCWRRQL